MKLLKINNRKCNEVYTMVDDEDYEFLSKWKWALSRPYPNGYVRRSTWVGKKTKDIKMHRILTNAPDGMEVDHIDGDILNNQKSNLRVVTKAVNCSNIHKAYASSGVLYAHQRGDKFVSRVRVNGIPKWLGAFNTPQEAHDTAIKYKQSLGLIPC